MLTRGGRWAGPRPSIAAVDELGEPRTRCQKKALVELSNLIYSDIYGEFGVGRASQL